VHRKILAFRTKAAHQIHNKDNQQDKANAAAADDGATKIETAATQQKNKDKDNQ
jgi:hypothetical protein